MIVGGLLPLLALLPVLVSGAPKPKGQKPNFIYIVTDDQDAASASPDIMPKLDKYLGQHGAYYQNFYTPVSQCCPSRVGFFRSQQGHSHNVTYVSAPYGGYPIFCEFGYQKEWLFTWLQRAGYFTSYVGKLMNGNNPGNAQTLPVQGIDESIIALDPNVYFFNNATYSFNNGPAVNFPNRYSTDHVLEMGLEHIEKGLKSGKPFFAGIAPIAPHFQFNNMTASFTPLQPPVPAERHAHLFPDAVAPRGASFNPEEPSGASYMRNFERLTQEKIDYNDNWYRMRIRSLQAVDELVEAIFKKVEAAGALDNTYIIYTADNGFSISQHRRNPGKTTGYEEDIRVPFVIRGPGIKKEVNSASAYANIDLSASILHLAGAEANIDIDGKLMPFAHKDATKKYIGTPNLHLSEFWVFNQDEGIYAIPPAVTQNNTYRVIRSIEEDSNWAYSVWCTGERELYDMTTDPTQMNNLLLPLNQQGAFLPWTSDIPGGRVASRLDAMTLYLKHCRGSQCRLGWDAIFPNGEASSLKEALDPRFDAYFDGLPKVHYKECRQGFVLENEFPIWTTELPYFEVPGGGIQYSNGSLTVPVVAKRAMHQPFAFPDHALA